MSGCYSRILQHISTLVFNLCGDVICVCGYALCVCNLSSKKNIEGEGLGLVTPFDNKALRAGILVLGS